MKKISFAFAVVLLTVISSCKKDEPNNIPTPAGSTIDTVRNLVADSVINFIPSPNPSQIPPQIISTNQYTFYNLRTNSRVPVSDSNSTNWDIAFKRTTIIINGGVSGPGQGGAYIFNGLFNELTSVTIDSMRIDSVGRLAIPNRSGNGWYVSSQPANLVTPIPGRVLVIRTADGKFAKMEIMNYYKGGVTPQPNASDSIKAYDARYYTFRYSIQRNGSTSF
jgi:hypothetical protein